MIIDSKKTQNLITQLGGFINTWTSNCKYCIKTQTEPNENFPAMEIFIAEFSKTLKEKPIPEISIRVYFLIPKNSKDLSGLRFRFEDEELIHSLDSFMKFNTIESYIER